MNNIKAVIFDVDNTLADRRKAFIRLCDYLIDKYSPEHPYQGPKEKLVEYMILIDKDGYGGIRNFIPKLKQKWELPLTTDEYIKERNEIFGKLTVPMDGLYEVIPELKKKYKLGIITNGYTRVQRDKINEIGITEYFDDIIVSEEAGFAKPDSKIFDMSLKNLNIKPEEAVYVGDYYPNDIAGALNAKIKPVWITDRLDGYDEYNGIRIHELKDLLRVL